MLSAESIMWLCDAAWAAGWKDNFMCPRGMLCERGELAHGWEFTCEQMREEKSVQTTVKNVYSASQGNNVRNIILKQTSLKKYSTHIELFHCPCSHAGILEVYEGTETLVQHSDALDFSMAGKNKQGQVNTTGWWKINKCNTAKPKSLGAPVLLFEKVPQVLLRQFCGYVTHPERRARTSEMEGEAEQ